MPHKIALSALILGLVFSLNGCAGFSLGGERAHLLDGDAETSGGEGVPIRPMTQVTMERLFAAEVDAIIGPSGAIQTQVDGVNVYLISDPAHDRMRIIAPIALTQNLDSRFYQIMLEANFHRTGDVRYGTAEGVAYAAFMHPISSLSPALLRSSLSQVLSLHKNFGKSFSSDVLELVPVSGAEAEGDSAPGGAESER
ncbi:MAG: hypothetical protein AB8G23_06770 [Myxococcota bacterium]